MGIGIVSDRVFQEVNERVCEITGYSKEELINQNARLVYPSDETYEYVGNEKYKQLRETGIGQVETQWKCKNGELRSILLRSSPINPADFTEGVIFTALDITEKKEAEKALIENEERYCAKLEEANNAKDKFFSIIAHDLKGPFNSILGFADILNTEYDDYSDEERKHFIRNIVSSAQNTYQLLENLLEWSRAQTNRLDFRPEVLELSSAINDSILLLRGQAEAKDIHIFSAVEFNTRVTADENMVKTITRNLLSNAIKFSRRRGNVRVMERHFTHPETHKEMTEIIVKDDGVGMSSTILGQIFQIDQMVKTPGTDNEKGTGLGLILCRELVLRNGGTIWADSEQGKGSAIHFTLPKA
ncbi:MAG: PAS domain-containing sensor histidine kinase [Bacteroidia bacterium]|nr:PAS domain-containing sensor histidine kinase [Bacteroidia bacterium]